MHDFNGQAESPFFRSSLLRDRLPLLFSNGASGLPGGEDAVGSVVRHIPIRMLGRESAAEHHVGRPSSINSNTKMGAPAAGRSPSPAASDVERGEGAKEMGDDFSFSSLPSAQLRRHFASLFWTPQQARRIAEREQREGDGPGPAIHSEARREPDRRRPAEPTAPEGAGGSGASSSVTVFSFPVGPTPKNGASRERRMPQVADSRRAECAANAGQTGLASAGPYSAVPFRRRTGGLHPAVSSPSLFPADYKSSPSPGGQKPPAPRPGPIQPTSFPAAIPPVLRRTQTTFSVPQQTLHRRDSEPAIVLDLAAAQSVSLSAAEEFHCRPNNLPESMGADSSLSAEDHSSLNGSLSSSSTGGGRVKSPSLSSLRQSLFRLRPSYKRSSQSASSASSLVPSCVRARQSSGGEAEAEQEEKEMDALSREREKTRNGGHKSLSASSLRLTEFLPRKEERAEGNQPNGNNVDAVEEAIRSLEQFDPGEFVQRQYSAERRPAPSRPVPVLAPRVFLAEQQPLPARQPLFASLSSLPASEGRRLSLCSLPSPSRSADEPESTGLPFRRPSVATLSSGSATPTGPPMPPAQHQLWQQDSESQDSNGTPRASSPICGSGLLGREGILLDRLGQPQPRASRVTFNENPVQHFYGPPPDYSDSGSSSEGASDQSTDENDEQREGDRSTAAMEAEAQLRKRFLCSQLTDCAKVVEINALKMGQFVAAGSGLGGWRQPHILRHNVAAIRDTCYTIEFALEELVESLGRIALEQRDPRRTQLRQLASPVQTSLGLLRRLRSSLDSTGWSLSALSRPSGPSSRSDALDQVAAILPQLPKDCSKLVQWVYSLSAWPDPSSGTLAAVFLSVSTSSGFQPRDPPSPAPVPQLNGIRHGRMRAPSPTSSLLNFFSPQEEEPKEKMTSEGRGTALAEVMDGGESTSSTSSVQTLIQQDQQHHLQQQQQQHNQQQNALANVNANANGNGRLNDANRRAVEGELILEEDDLASVVSESPVDCSQWPQPAPNSPPGPLHQRKVNAELAHSLSPDQRDLFRLYESQMAGHTTALCALIEDLFGLLESHRQQDQKLSFQKIQMIFIEGHSLIGIVRVLSRDDTVAQHRPLLALLEHESARLESLLNECLATAKVARAKAQTVFSAQAICSAVVGVSECANRLRGLWRTCAGGQQN